MRHGHIPGVSQYKCEECGLELRAMEPERTPQGARYWSDDSADWCTGYRDRPWPPRECNRCGGRMIPWREANFTRSTFHACPGCGREKVTSSDPCPNCDGHPVPDPNWPRVWCADCGWEPPLDFPTPRSHERYCRHCGSERIHWQGNTPIAYCKRCHAVINSREEYCSRCWHEWQNIDVWDPSDPRHMPGQPEDNPPEAPTQEELPLHLDACHECALRAVGMNDDGSDLSEGYLDQRRQAFHSQHTGRTYPQPVPSRGVNELGGGVCSHCGTGSRRRARKNSWSRPERRAWGDTGRSSWSGWQTWGDTGGSSNSGWQHQGTETEAMLRQPETWGAIPPPTSLEAGIYRAENYYPRDVPGTESQSSGAEPATSS